MNFTENNNRKGRYTLIMLAVFVSIFAVASVFGYCFGYGLYADGVLIGTFHEQSDAVKTSDTLKEESEAGKAENFEIIWGKVENGFTDVDTALNNYRKMNSCYAHGYSLVLNGEKIFTLSSKEDVIAVKEEVLALYEDVDATDIHFIGKADIKEEYVLKEALKDKATAFELLKEKAIVETVVKTGYYETVPYETETLEDENLYVDEIVIESPGKEGKKFVEYTEHKLNGVSDTEVLTGDFFLEGTEKKVVRKGTKPYPKGEAIGIFRQPVKGYISSHFGARWGRTHKGIDVAAPFNEPIFASDGGEVIYAGWMGGYGNLIQIDHKNGYVTYYAHCSKLHVKAGDKVAKGDFIADVGSTGNSTGPHLHFEVRLDNVNRNPIEYVNY